MKSYSDDLDLEAEEFPVYEYSRKNKQHVEEKKRFYNYPAIGASLEFIAKARLNPSAKLVLIVIATHVKRGTNESHPGIRLLAEESGFHTKTVEAALVQLQKLKAIKVQNRNELPGKHNSYKLLFYNGW